jgi:hypothetical protein
MFEGVFSGGDRIGKDVEIEQPPVKTAPEGFISLDDQHPWVYRRHHAGRLRYKDSATFPVQRRQGRATVASSFGSATLAMVRRAVSDAVGTQDSRRSTEA